MKTPKVYYFAKIMGLEGYANKTEPTKYPDAFVEFVRKEDHDKAVGILIHNSNQLESLRQEDAAAHNHWRERAEHAERCCVAYRQVVLAMQPMVEVGCLNAGERYKPVVANLNEKLAALQVLIPDVAAPQRS
jgi:hypothetical protein